MKELVMVRMGQSLVPQISHDASLLESIAPGQAVKVRVCSMKERSRKQHNLYFGGLLELAADYFEPAGGVIQKGEVRVLKNFIRFIERHTGGPQAGLRNAYGQYLSQLRQARADKVAQPELKRHQLIRLLHEWVKEEAGLYDVVLTPAGPRRQIRSMSIDSMDADDFDAYFREAFNVIWRFLLSTPMGDDQRDVIFNKLMAMG